MSKTIYDELKEDFARIALRAYNRGLTSASGGNISVRVGGTNNVLIKPSGVSFADVSPERLVLIDFDSRILEGKGKPSKEIKFHLGIYRTRKDVNAVMHIHSPAATAFAVVKREIPMITVHASKILGRVPLIGFAPPGSTELANLVIKTFENASVKAALLEKHGVVTVGKGLTEAEYFAELVEETAQIALFSLYLTNQRL